MYFFLQDVENWPDPLGSDMQKQYHESSFLTSGSSASVTSLFYPKVSDMQTDYYNYASYGTKEPELYFKVTFESSELQCGQLCWRL